MIMKMLVIKNDKNRIPVFGMFYFYLQTKVMYLQSLIKVIILYFAVSI